jgi:hypothetical protein
MPGHADALVVQLNSKPVLVFVTLLLPVLVALLGLWQVQRGAEYLNFLEGQRASLATQLVDMQAAPLPELGGINTAIRFEADGTTYVGDFALNKMQEALSQIDVAITIAQYRQVLPPVVIATAMAVLLIGFAVLVGAVALAGFGLRSRPALLASFSAVRRLLPGTLIAVVVLTCLAIVCAIFFEVAALVRLDNLGRGQVYLLGIALGLVAIAIVTAWQALAQLRGFSLLFTPEPYDLIAESVSREQAPGLWALVDEFAQNLGAPVPDTIALGLTHGFFVVTGRSICCQLAALSAAIRSMSPWDCWP